MAIAEFHDVVQKVDVMPDSAPRKKVMLISPNFGGGGAERSIAKLSISLSEKNYDVHFVIFNVFPGREQVYPIKGLLHVLDIPAGKSYFGKAIRFIQRVRKVKRLKRELKIDVCISFLEGADYVNILSKKEEKVVISIRGSKENDDEIKGPLGWLRKRILMPWLYKKTDTIVCVSEGIRLEIEGALSLGLGKATVIYNYYDVDAIKSLGNEPLPPYAERLFEQPCVISIGRLHPQKNHAGLIRSFAHAKKLGSDYKLVILGNGELKGQLINLCESLKLSVSSLVDETLNPAADIVFLGYQKNPWLFMSKASIFVLSSSWEGFPNALAEAMCLGLPVISTACPHGPCEMLSDEPLRLQKNDVAQITKYGALIPVLNEEKDYIACGEIIELFLKDNQLSLAVGNAGQNRIRTFSAESVLEGWLDVIEGRK